MFIETLYEQKKKEHNMCDDHNIWRLWREIKTCFTKNTHKTQSRNGDKTKVCKKKEFLHDDSESDLCHTDELIFILISKHDDGFTRCHQQLNITSLVMFKLFI